MPLTRLEHLVAAQPLETSTAWYAVDESRWPRCDAETSPQRGYYHHHSRHSNGQPIGAFWNSSWLVQIPERCSSWAAQLAGAADAAGRAFQSCGSRADSLVPAPTQARQAVSSLHLRCWLRAGAVGGGVSRTRRERPGAAAVWPLFLRGPATGTDWRASAAAWDPRSSVTIRPPGLRLPASGIQRMRTMGRCGSAAGVACTLSHTTTKNGERARLVLLSAGPSSAWRSSTSPNRPKFPCPVFLWWCGPEPPDLATIWRVYVARFSIEHTYRFFKQVLKWTTPKLRSPEALDRWTWLLILAYVQLRLARPLVVDHRLRLSDTASGGETDARSRPTRLFVPFADAR
jgi:hypothetical protein